PRAPGWSGAAPAGRMGLTCTAREVTRANFSRRSCSEPWTLRAAATASSARWRSAVNSSLRCAVIRRCSPNWRYIQAESPRRRKQRAAARASGHRHGGGLGLVAVDGVQQPLAGLRRRLLRRQLVREKAQNLCIQARQRLGGFVAARRAERSGPPLQRLDG